MFIKVILTAKHYFSVGYFFLKLSVMAQMEYPAFLIGWFLANAMQFFFGIGTLWLLMNNFPHINGWTFDQIAFMYGIAILSHSLSILLFIQTWGMEWHVTEGEFDRMLLRPLNVYYQFAVNYINFIGFTDMLPGIIIFAYGAIAVGFVFSPGNTVRLVLVIAGATLLRGAMFTITGSVAFWTKRSRKLIDVFGELANRLGMYPTSIFGKVLQGVFTFILPMAFISFYPASEFLGMDTGFSIPGEVSLWTIGIGIFLMVLAVRFFNRGLRHYDSAGS